MSPRSPVGIFFFTVMLMEANWKRCKQPFLLCYSSALNGLLCVTCVKCLLMGERHPFPQATNGPGSRLSRCCFGCLAHVCLCPSQTSSFEVQFAKEETIVSLKNPPTGFLLFTAERLAPLAVTRATCIYLFILPPHLIHLV